MLQLRRKVLHIGSQPVRGEFHCDDDDGCSRVDIVIYSKNNKYDDDDAPHHPRNYRLAFFDCGM